MVNDDQSFSMAIAGVQFDVHPAAESIVDEWVLVIRSGLVNRVLESYSDAGFVAVVSDLGSDRAYRTISRWPILAPEFGWPAAAGECGCLTNERLAEVALVLNGSSLVRVAGTVFDHFLIRRELLGDVVGDDIADTSVDAADWLTRVGVDNSWMTGGFIDTSPRSTELRDALEGVDDPWLNDQFVRALDTYSNGGSATMEAQALREAFVEHMLDHHDSSYRPTSGSDAVRREIYVLNSVRMRVTVCCTSIEHEGRRIFGTPMERLTRGVREPVHISAADLKKFTQHR